MRLRLRRLLVCLSCAALHGPALAAGTSLRAIKPWDVDYGETQCTGLREYGGSNGSVTLAIVPAPNGESYALVVTYKGKSSRFAEESAGSVIFASRPITAWALKYGIGELTFYQLRLSSIDMAQAISAPTITIRTKGDLDVTFALDNMRDLIDGLRKCTADLQDYWNVGGEKNGRIAVPSKGNIRYVFSASDYPLEALYRGQSGTSQYMLLIDEKGSVAGCHVLKPSGVPALDAMGCLVIRERSKLTPARDASGKPVRSTFVTPPVTWRVN